MKISKSAVDLLIVEEVTSQAYYTRHYTRPEWPGVSSGVTVGVGYDLGQASVAKITADWSDHVSAEMLAVMVSCSGIIGVAAKSKLAQVKNKINIPWEAAYDVFCKRDIPQWTSLVLKLVPGAKDLSPTCLGVQVSVSYNRGACYNNVGDRYTEMRQIKIYIDSGPSHWPQVAGELRSMKRLWPGVPGLQNRREHEAVLWNKGLTSNEPAMGDIPDTPVEPNPTIPTKEGPARTKPPATSKTQNGTTMVIVAAGGAAAQQAHAHDLITSGSTVFLVIGVAIAAAIVWYGWYCNRNPS